VGGLHAHDHRRGEGQGGEALEVSDVKGGLSDTQWAPDSTRLAFVMSDVNPADEPE